MLERLLLHHKIDFFNRLKEELYKRGIELSLIYGKSKEQKSSKNDERDMDWAEYYPNKTISIGGKEIIWQPVVKDLPKFDLVIVEYANRNLINYYMMLKRLVSGSKMAFWGHVRNPFIKKKDFRNKIKQAYLKQCDWWFAYTDSEQADLVDYLYPKEQITVVRNAIDTKSLQRAYNAIDSESIVQLKKELNINSDNIGIYCGSIYKEKRLDFLIEAADIIRDEVQDFHLLILGAGPDDWIVKEAIKSRPWIHYVGSKFEEERVAYFKIAKVFLMPGALGLAILDSFALSTPMVIPEFPHHGPEFEYVENGFNAIVSENNVASFANEAITMFKDDEKLERLRNNCLKEAEKYTIETMIENFAEGLEKCLNNR